jgi:hypothetical protein
VKNHASEVLLCSSYHAYEWPGSISFKKEMKQQMDKQTNAKRLKTEDSRQSM